MLLLLLGRGSRMLDILGAGRRLYEAGRGRIGHAVRRTSRRRPARAGLRNGHAHRPANHRAWRLMLVLLVRRGRHDNRCGRAGTGSRGNQLLLLLLLLVLLRAKVNGAGSKRRGI